MTQPELAITPEPAARDELRRGFIDTMPLWVGAAPFGIAYALAALAAGLSPLQTQAMSLLVFAGASQLTAAGLFAAGAGPLSIVATTLIVNLRHLLLAASLRPALRVVGWLQRAGLAAMITDESYAITVRRLTSGEGGPRLLLGANLSLYVCWQSSTAIGILLGRLIPDPTRLGLELVFPLSFLVLLMPYLRGRPALAAAAVGGALALVMRLVLPGSWYLLIAALGGALTGAWLDQEVTA